MDFVDFVDFDTLMLQLDTDALATFILSNRLNEHVSLADFNKCKTYMIDYIKQNCDNTELLFLNVDYIIGEETLKMVDRLVGNLQKNLDKPLQINTYNGPSNTKYVKYYSFVDNEPYMFKVDPNDIETNLETNVEVAPGQTWHDEEFIATNTTNNLRL